MAEIVWDLKAETAQFEAGLKKAEGALKRAEKSGDKAAKSTDRVGKEAASAAPKLKLFSMEELAAAGSGRMLAGDLEGLEDALDGAGKSAGSASGGMGDLAGGIPGLSKLTAALSNPVAAAGAGLVAMAAGLQSAASSASEYSDKIGKLSKRTSISVETLLALEGAAEESGSSLDEVKEALTGLSGKVKEASKDGSEAAKQFEALGVSVKDGSGELRSMDAILGDVISTIEASGDGTAGTTAAITLMGESGTKLTAALRDGSSSLDEWRDKTALLAASMRDGTAAGDQFNTKNAEMSANVKTLTQAIGSEFQPVSAGFTDWLSNAAKGAAFLVMEMGGMVDSITSLFPALASTAKQMEMLDAEVQATADSFSGWDELGDLPLKEWDEDAAGASEAVAAFEAEVGKAAETADKMAGSGSGAAAGIAATGKAAEDSAMSFNDLIAKMEEAAQGENEFNDAAVAGAKAQVERDAAMAKAAEERAAAEQEHAERYVGLQAIRAQAAIDARAAEEEIEAARMEAMEAEAAARAEMNQNTVDGAIAAFEAITDAFAMMQESIIAGIDEETERRTSALERDEERLAEFGDNMTEQERSRLEGRIKNNKNHLKMLEEMKKREMRKAFIADKVSSIGRAAINTALSITSALTIPPPAGPILAGVNAAAGAIQVAAIAARPPPFRLGGVVPDSAPRLPGGLSDQRLIAAEPGEMVLNQEQQAAIGGRGPIFVAVQIGAEQLQEAVARVLDGREAERIFDRRAGFREAFSG